MNVLGEMISGGGCCPKITLTIKKGTKLFNFQSNELISKFLLTNKSMNNKWLSRNSYPSYKTLLEKLYMPQGYNLQPQGCVVILKDIISRAFSYAGQIDYL